LLPLALTLTPVWLKTRTRHPRLWRGAVLALTGSFVVLLVGGYRQDWRWTGFTGNTLWAWVSLFIVPFLLPFAFGILAVGEKRRTVHPDTGSEEEQSATVSAAERIAPWVGTAVLTIAVIVAALLFFGSPPKGMTTSASITVQGRNPQWTATPLWLERGDRVDVSAFGLLLPSPRSGYHYVTPAGLQPPHQGQLSISEQIPHAALIATVARHAPAPLGNIGAGHVIPVGTHVTITTDTAGRLYLGINDRKTSDNTGRYDVTLKLRPRP
jgi:hypothetical protein